MRDLDKQFNELKHCEHLLRQAIQAQLEILKIKQLKEIQLLIAQMISNGETKENKEFF